MNDAYDNAKDDAAILARVLPPIASTVTPWSADGTTAGTEEVDPREELRRELEREHWELEQLRSQPTEEDLINWREADDYRDEGFDYDDYE